MRDGPGSTPPFRIFGLERSFIDANARAFAEADSRDPEHCHDWAALVDGANHQIDRIKAEAKSRGAEITIVVDCAHVPGYIWDAA